MDRKPTYEELKQRVRELEEEVSDLSQFKEKLRRALYDTEEAMDRMKALG